MSTTEKQLVPKNATEREAWVTKLKEAGVEYRLEKVLGTYAIYVAPDVPARVLNLPPDKPWPVWKKLLLWATGIVLLLALCTPKDRDPEPAKALTPQEQAQVDSLAAVAARNEKIRMQFNPWNGEHINITAALKKELNDAESYEHVNTDVYDMGDKLVVKCTFRAANGFGAKVLNSYYAEVDLDGNILEWKMQ